MWPILRRVGAWNVLFTAIQAAAGFLAYWWWQHQLPPTGYAVAIIAVMAATDECARKNARVAEGDMDAADRLFLAC